MELFILMRFIDLCYQETRLFLTSLITTLSVTHQTIPALQPLQTCNLETHIQSSKQFDRYKKSASPIKKKLRDAIPSLAETYEIILAHQVMKSYLPPNISNVP